jgi:RHS repeat-associated protein
MILNLSKDRTTTANEELSLYSVPAPNPKSQKQKTPMRILPLASIAVSFCRTFTQRFTSTASHAVSPPLPKGGCVLSLSKAGRGEGCLHKRYSRDGRVEGAPTTEPIPHFKTPTSRSARTRLRTVREMTAATLARISQRAHATVLFGIVGWVAKPSAPVGWRRWVSCICPACGLTSLRLSAKFGQRFFLFTALAVFFSATQLVSAASLPECELVDASGIKVNECTDPIEVLYAIRLGNHHLNLPPRPVRYFTSNNLGQTITKYLQAFNAYELEQRNYLIATNQRVQWADAAYQAGSCESGPSQYSGTIYGEDAFPPDYYQASNAYCRFPYYVNDEITGRTLNPASLTGQWNSTAIAVKCPEGTRFIKELYGNEPFKCIRAVEKPYCKATFGNPIAAQNLVKHQAETLLSVGGELSKFARIHYSYPAPVPKSTFGAYWQPEYLRSLTARELGEAGVTTPRVILHKNSEMIIFRPSGSNWLPDADIQDRLTELKNTSGVRTGWTFYEAATETKETYDTSGRLMSILARNGVTVTLSYNVSGQLASVTDSFGRSVSYAYFASTTATGAGNVASVTDHLGNTTSFAYDAKNNLTSVTYPGLAAKTFVYGEAVNTVNVPFDNALAGIVDENGVRFASFGYDNSSLAVSTEYANGVNKYSLSGNGYSTSTTITDPLGTQRTLTFASVLGAFRVTGVSEPCPSCGGSASQATTYDANGNIASKTDFNGNRTNYVFDLTRNLETSRTEALTSTGATTPQTRTLTTVWHPTYRLPTKITESVTGGNRITDFTYDASGNMLTRKVTAPKNDGSTGAAANDIRAWTYTYNALGQVLTAKDPLNKTTTTAYYPATDTVNNPPQYTKGDVQTITNAAGHVTTLNAYDKNGRPTQMTDANGLITTMSYHPRGWLTSRAVNNGTTTETTTYTYDNVGQLTRVTMPDASTFFYAYDAAHRLVGMSDQATGVTLPANPNTANTALIITPSNLSGNKILYTLDPMGNRIKEQHFDPSGALAKQKQRAIDSLNRLQQDVGGSAYAATAPAGAPTAAASLAPGSANAAPVNAAITQYSYDNNGNVTGTTDPLGRTTTNQYDALNRLTKVIDPYNGAAKGTIYAYDTANNLTSVTDPEGKQAVYTYNGHNNLITQVSPDTGSTKFQYNVMGNVTAKIDSMNRCATTAYDNLHRATSIKYYAASNAATNTSALCFGTIASTVSPEETQTYTYDSITATLGGAGGKGRISRIADATGRVDYVYDKNGRITSKTQVVTGATNPNRVITYSYNAFGQMSSMTTPSGQTINYSYGAPTSSNPGKLIAMQLNGTTNLITNADYKPFGPNEGWDWGNSGTTLTSTPPINQHLRQFDLDYRPTTIGNDPEGYSRNIAWDRANRITGITVPTTGAGSLVPGIANGQSLNQAFAYDTLDRLTQFNAGVNGATTAATGLALLPTETFTYDGIGNRKSRTTQAPGATSTQATSYTHGNSATTPINHWLTNSTGQLPNAYTYDASGNTLTESAALAAMNPTTGQMNATTGTPVTSALAYTYDAKNRLTKVQISPGGSSTPSTTDTVTYKINAMGQRVQKVGAGLYAPSTTTTINATTGQSPQGISLNFNARYVYDEQGRINGEYANDGKLIAETIWFNDLPIATLRPKGSNAGTPLGITGTTTGNPANGATATNANNVGTNTATNRVNVEIFYIHPDHLGTPRVVTRSTIATGTNAPSSATANSPGSINKAVWRWNSDPFGTSLGNSQPTENPQLITGTQTIIQAGTFRQNLGFPGNTRDAETGKEQNYFRERDGVIGRYTTSDPIGLAAGPNTFAYTDNDPIDFSDAYGLQKSPPRIIPPSPWVMPPLMNAPRWQPTRVYTGNQNTCGMCFEVFSVIPIRGNSRSSHRNSSLELLDEWLARYPGLRDRLNQECNCDVQQHMRSGANGGFLNPPGFELHHPVGGSGVVWLMRRCDHRNPGLQDFLHPLPGRGGGFVEAY